ncbi:MAG: AbrB/MazE/SpoVT family DNA-binding domain-containing protein [Candidatus Krumholzibacteriota bacterium]
MRTKIVKWGNSLGLRIPKAFAEEVRVTEGSVVDLSMEDGNLVVKVANPDEVDLKDLLDEITDENIHGEIDTGDAVGGEVW